MLRWAIKQEKTPVALRVPTGEVVHTTEQVDAEYGYEPQYKVAHRGSKVAVVAAGSFYQKGESVVGLLAEKGIDATLINPRYLNDVDAATLDALKSDHQLVVTLEDGCKDGGFGERIVEQLLSDNRLLDAQIVEDALAALGE